MRLVAKKWTTIDGLPLLTREEILDWNDYADALEEADEEHRKREKSRQEAAKQRNGGPGGRRRR